MELATHAFDGDDTEYVTPSWTDLQQLTFSIATQVRAQNKCYDRIVTLAKGGWPMTLCLVDFLAIEQVASIGVKFYTGINERLAQPVIYQDLPTSVAGERVLLFDDVADTGNSLQFTKEYLLTYRGVDTVDTATLFYKEDSIIKPDYYGTDSEAWIIFPYDAADMIKVLGNKWYMDDVSAVVVAERFKQLGFQQSWIEFYS